LDAARAARLAAVTMLVLPENLAMRELARSFETHFTLECGELYGTCKPV
jgi:hypothetical protein